MKLSHLIRKRNPNCAILKETHLKHKDAEKLKSQMWKKMYRKTIIKKKLAKVYLDQIK